MRDQKQTNRPGRARRDAREAVLLALLSRVRNDTFSNVLVKRTLDDCAEMSTAERAFIKRLLEGVIERKTELDARIEHFTGRSVTRLHPVVHQILRMGIYQICYMDSVPDSAVCNEAVRLAKRRGPARLSGFVNGVLRSAARQAASSEGSCDVFLSDKGGVNSPCGEKDPADQLKALSLKNSMPEWLVEMWSDQLGMEETEKLLDALMEIRPVSIRLSGRLSDEERERLLEQLRSAGVTVDAGKWLADCRYLRRTSDLRKLPGFSERNSSASWPRRTEPLSLRYTAVGRESPSSRGVGAVASCTMTGMPPFLHKAALVLVLPISIPNIIWHLC
jgi:16S rRNA (cytosine967-C5)-methyltransferase